MVFQLILDNIRRHFIIYKQRMSSFSHRYCLLLTISTNRNSLPDILVLLSAIAYIFFVLLSHILWGNLRVNAELHAIVEHPANRDISLNDLPCLVQGEPCAVEIDHHIWSKDVL